jgi:Sigma-70, region 4
VIETLDELARLLIAKGLDYESISSNLRIETLVRRFGLPGKKITLDEAGKSLNLTRERIRQQELQVRSTLKEGNTFFDQGILDRAIDVIVAATNVDQISPLLIKFGYTDDKNWDLDSLLAMCELAGNMGAALRLRELKERLEKTHFKAELVRQTIEQIRGFYGFIDFESLRQVLKPSIDVTPEYLLDYIATDFTHFAISGKVLYAPAMSTSVRSLVDLIASQLDVAEGRCLHASELFNGIRRHLAGHSRRIVDRPRDVIRAFCLATDIFNFDDTTEIVSLSRDLARSPSREEDGVAEKIVRLLKKDSLKAIHNYDLLHWAINEGIKPTTAIHTWKYDFRIREEDRVFYLVGNRPIEKDLELLRDAAKISYMTKPYLNIGVTAESGQIQLSPVWISSNNILLDPAQKGLLSNITHAVCERCSYPQQSEKFKFAIEISGNRLQLGPKVVNHLIEEHHIVAMAWIDFFLLGTDLVLRV